MLDRWDFEGEITFLTPEEGGLSQARMGLRPAFSYPDSNDATHFDIWPVAAFHANGTPYEVMEPFERVAWARFYVVNRDLWESVHRHRLRPGLGFELWEGNRRIATGCVLESPNPVGGPQDL